MTDRHYIDLFIKALNHTSKPRHRGKITLMTRHKEWKEEKGINHLTTYKAHRPETSKKCI